MTQLAVRSLALAVLFFSVVGSLEAHSIKKQDTSSKAPMSIPPYE